MISRQRQKQIRELLIAKKRGLLTEVRKAMGDKLSEDVRMTFETLHDNPDRSVDELLKHVNAAIVGNKSEEIDQIDSALARLAEQSYGVCEDCGRDIPVKRLTAVPFAACCVECQGRQDDQNKERALSGRKAESVNSGDDYLSEEE